MFEDESVLTFKRQVKLIALGALIGFLPAFVNTLVQNRFQRQNIVLSRRLALIQSLSSFNAQAGSILARAINLQTKVDSLAKGNPSIQDERDIALQMEKVNEDEHAMVAGFKTQMITLGALYGKQLSPPGSEWVLTPFSPTRPKGGDLAKMHDELETIKAHLVGSMDSVQHICEDIAESVDQ